MKLKYSYPIEIMYIRRLVVAGAACSATETSASLKFLASSSAKVAVRGRTRDY